jgi:GNAT superfamily N-acetyltransferase
VRAGCRPVKLSGMGAAERVAEGFVAAERSRALAAPHGEVVELDGIVMAFTNLPDEGLNAGVVVGMPADPAGTLAAAAAAAHERGQPLGLEVERGRHPELEAALTAAGLTKLFSHPALVADPASMWHSPAPPGLVVTRVSDATGLAAMVSVEIEAFGTDPEVARGLLTSGMLRDQDTRAFVGMMERRPVAQSIGYHHAGAGGVFGVGVRPPARRRGIGAAITVAAATSVPEVNLVWLHPTEMARSMYERLGFHEAAVWDVWTAPRPA